MLPCRRPGSSSTDRLWKEYFADPSQWWDIRKSKTNPRSPDFKHKITKESLWIDGWYNPGWVTEKLDHAIKGMHEAKSPSDQASSKSAHAFLLREGGKDSFSSGVQVSASKAQDPQKSGWEMLSSEEALNSLEQMPQPPSAENLTSILHKCRKSKDLVHAKRLHAYMCKCGLEAHSLLANYLVPMWIKVGSMSDAQQVFNKLADRSEFSWTALITAYVENGNPQHALILYQKMQEDCVNPSEYTYVALLKACSMLQDEKSGQNIHAEIARKGLGGVTFLGSTLVDMYSKCGLLSKAQEVFDQLPVRDVVSWTALIAGYVEHGLGEEALDCFERMQVEGVSPNAFTFVCSLKACGSIAAIAKGQEIHLYITRKRLLERNHYVRNALVDMYAKCGLLAKAQEVFDRLLVRDVVSWTALIAGYTEHGLGVEALNSFKQMQLEGISPDAVTFVCSLKACGNIGAINMGQQIHAEISKKGLERDLFIGSTLVDMYAKCGLTAKALEVFDNLSVRDVVSWTALIAGYAHHGESDNVFHMLEKMRQDNKKPNGVTFLSVLAVCSHTGLVDNGQKYFEVMRKSYDVTPTIEHHTCMVDLLARAGQLDKAVAMMKKMPFHPDLVVLYTVLGACQKWGNVELGRKAFDHAVQLDEMDTATYVFMSNIYAGGYMQEDE